MAEGRATDGLGGEGTVGRGERGERGLRVAFARELDALPVSPPDVDRLRRDAAAGVPPAVGRAVRAPLVAAAAVCLLVVGVGLLAIRLADREPVVLGGAPVTSEAPAAEAGRPPADRSPQPATAEALAGRTFRSVGELPGAPIPDAVVTLAFGTGGRGSDALVGTSEPGCNDLRTAPGGRVELDVEGRLVLGALLQTLMDCPDGEVDQEDWLIRTMADRPRLLLDGPVLIVETPAGEIRLIDTDPDAVQPDTGDPACDAVAVDVVDLVERFLLSIDPSTGLPDGTVEGDVDGELQAALAEAGCDEQVLRREATEVLYQRIFARYDADWITARQTALGAIVIGLNAEDFGLASPLPIPTAQPRPPSPTATPTPLPSDGGGVAWCGERGLAGAVVTTAGSLEALCHDGGRVAVDAGPGWTSVDVGTLRMVAERVDPATGEASFTEYALAGGGVLSRTTGTAPALSPGDRLAWVDQDGAITWDGATSGAIDGWDAASDLAWDRDGRTLLVRTAPDVVLAVSAQPDDIPDRSVSMTGLIAMTGEVDTPGNVVLLVDRERLVALAAAFVDGSGPAEPFGLASTTIPSATFGEQAFVEAVGLLRPDAASGTWSQGTSIGWVVGDGSTAWYVDGTADPLVLGTDIRHLAIRPPRG